jgi:hypothetical protein
MVVVLIKIFSKEKERGHDTKETTMMKLTQNMPGPGSEGDS